MKISCFYFYLWNIFSCESEDDDEWVEIKHARTGAAKKKRKKEESDEEDEEFACKKCGECKLKYFQFEMQIFSLFRPRRSPRVDPAV